MFKLYIKKGRLQQSNDNYKLPFSFKLATDEIECLYYFGNVDLRDNDEVVLVGCNSKDDFDDSVFWVHAYYNVSHKKISSTRPSILRASKWAIVLMLLLMVLIICMSSKISIGDFIFLFFMLIFFAFVSFLLGLTLRAYKILNLEILNLE